MKYGLLLEPKDLQKIINEYRLQKNPEEYGDDTMQDVISKYFSTNKLSVVKTNRGYIVLMKEEEGE